MTAVTETRPATRSPKAFAAVAAIVVLFLAASSAPSPLYVVYQRQWGFSSSVLTLVFAIYVVGLLGSLLVVGALSDHVGRRPVLASAILLEALSLGVFLVAGDVTVLCVARFLQGVATGAATTTLGATLVDLNPPHRPGRAGAVNGSRPRPGSRSARWAAARSSNTRPRRRTSSTRSSSRAWSSPGSSSSRCPNPRNAAPARSRRCARASACRRTCAPRC